VQEEAMSNASEAASMLFKPVAGGYVFQSPNPWVFGRTSRYIVNEAQKAAILDISTPHRPMLRVTVITIGVLAWAVAAATIVWAVSPHADPTVIDGVAIFALVLFPIYAALVIGLQRNLRRMQPIIAGAPRTDMRITHAEMRRACANAISTRRALVYAALWTFTSSTQVFSLVVRNARHPLFSDLQSFLNMFTAVVAAGLAIHYLVMAIRKMRQNPAAC
jgi:hypothetical protein